jgi:hypothetical protein
MARKSRIVSATSSTKPPKRKRVAIPEAYRVVTPAAVASNPKIKVPMLVLYGEWLNAIGFPVGSDAYLISDKRGELALHRVGLGMPWRLKVRAVPG